MMDVIAHRGVSSLAPENTLLAVKKALQLHVSWIEIDCQLTHDKRVVAFHDYAFTRAAGEEPMPIADVPYDILATHNRGKGQNIPLLEDILDLIAGSCELVIEIKNEGAIEVVLDMLKKKNYLNHVHISSSILSDIMYTQKQVPQIPVSLVVNRYIPDLSLIVQYYNIRVFSVKHTLVKRSWITMHKRKGLTIRLFTINDQKKAQQYRAWGVDAIFTDYPQLLLPPVKKPVPVFIET